MFSPYYAASGWADPLDHCTMNVALYGPRGGLWSPGWAMTERGRGDLVQETQTLQIGPSSLSWEGDTLVVRIDETTTPVPSSLRGTIRLHPQALVDRTFQIGGAGSHEWRPVAPRATVEVALDRPGISWKGQGYFDTNGGDSPLERAFSLWNWSRAHRARDTLIFYEVESDFGEGAKLALKIDAGGEVEAIEPPPLHSLRPTVWLMPRHVRGDAADPPRIRRTCEDAPFYTRTALDGMVLGERAEIMHESLSAKRLRSPIVKRMLPYRMPRSAR